MPHCPIEAAQTAIMLSSVSSTSLSSSLSSSAGDSVLLPAAPASNSSQSDIITPDHSVSSSSTKHLFPPGAITPAPRSSSLPSSMGQILSRPIPLNSSSQSPPPSPSRGTSSTNSAGSRLKRVFAGRRKKSEDASLIFSTAQPAKFEAPEWPRTEPLDPPQKGSGLTPTFNGKPGPSHVPQVPSPTAQADSGPVSSPSSPDFSSVPPTPPPKPLHRQMPLKPQLSPSPSPRADQRGAFMISSTSIAPALEYITENEKASDILVAVSRSPREKKDQEMEKSKQEWRKSDATTTSYHTVRPRSATTSGTRTPRPVSMAESLHSTHTVVPTNKRLSAIITEAEFTMPEESVESGYSTSPPAGPLGRKTSPSGSLSARKRHSISIHFTSPFSPAVPVSPPHDVPVSHRSVSPPPRPMPMRRTSKSDTPTLTRAAANGIIAPSRSTESSQSTGSHIKGRLAAWTAASASASAPTSPRPVPQPPLPAPHHQHETVPPHSVRQTTTSMTNGLAPAAGFAMGFGKRAVEKMGRAWGNLSSHHGGNMHASSAGKLGPGSFPDNKLGRTSSNQSSSSHLPSTHGHLGKGKQRRTPNAPSGSWSISSSVTSSSVSDSDAFGSSQGPRLGRRLRGPMRPTGSGAPVAGGLVFGRELQTCVRNTAIDPVRLAMSERNGPESSIDSDLEERLLPALIVRCVQHLSKWGVEEEGLFRISGRASHIAKLRAEFDTGADYYIAESTPGDLDPHAVSSIFKAFLRELPEPILTHALNPYFEAAMIAENTTRKSEESPLNRVSVGSRGPGLPSGPRDGPALRKPPSLSTLAMPNFAGLRAPSASLLAAFTNLIARLPPVNRDLLRTVTELINATARRKETRMPLSNLTLIFCPSLNMSPQILRVLCESASIWNVPPPPAAAEPVTRNSKETDEVEIAPHDSDHVEEAVQDDDGSEGPSEIQTQTSSLSDAPIVADPDHDLDGDAYAHSDISSIQGSARMSSTDDSGSYMSASEARRFTLRGSVGPLYNPHSPPPLSSSAESLITPSTSSEGAPFPQPVLLAPDDDDPSTSKRISSSRPAIADLENLSMIPSIHRLSPPITFPTSESTPDSPASARHSSHLVSLSPSMMADPHGAPLARTNSKLARSKRPSLTALFSKRSMSSLRSSKALPATPGDVPIPTPPSRYSGIPVSPTSSGSPSTPLSATASMVTAPSGSTFDLPPVLNMSLETSPLNVVFGGGGGGERKADATSPREKAKALSAPASRDRSASPHPAAISVPSSLSSPPPPPPPPRSATATATATRDPPKASPPPALAPPPALRAQLSTASLASVSSSSSSYNRLSLWDDAQDTAPEEDWASSVLSAADAGWAAAASGSRGQRGRI